jgi:hypothetical protein
VLIHSNQCLSVESFFGLRLCCSRKSVANFSSCFGVLVATKNPVILSKKFVPTRVNPWLISPCNLWNPWLYYPKFSNPSIFIPAKLLLDLIGGRVSTFEFYNTILNFSLYIFHFVSIRHTRYERRVHFRIFSNVSLHFSNVSHHFSIVFNRFRTFLFCLSCPNPANQSPQPRF